MSCVQLPPLPAIKRFNPDNTAVKTAIPAADGSGAIDREDLAPLLGQLGIWVSAEMARKVFPRLDLDCSGDVRQEELAMWLENVSTC